LLCLRFKTRQNFGQKILTSFIQRQPKKQPTIFIFYPKQSNIIEVMVQELHQPLPTAQVHHLP